MRRFIAIFTVVLFAGVCLVCGYIVGSEGVFSGGKSSGTNELLEAAENQLIEVENTINKNFYKDVDTDMMIVGMLKGLAASTEDPYSMYMTAEEYEAYKEGSSGTYAGVGILMTLVDNQAIVKEVYEGGSALEEGLKVDDIIIEADGQDVSQIEALTEVSNLLRGEVGTKVTAKVKRGDETVSFELERRQIKMRYVESRMLEGDLGYIKLKEFSGECSADFKAALDQLQSDNAKGLIIDLRNNPGGYVRDAVNIADMLLPKGLIVYTEDKNGSRQEYTSDAAHVELPMVVLINEDSASASEILAGAIQDYQAADLVGMLSYGKGIVQKPFNIKSTGGALMLTISSYYTPNGRSIHGDGLHPDYEVDLPAELKKDIRNGDAQLTDENDTQLHKAIEILRGKVAADAEQEEDGLLAA